MVKAAVCCDTNDVEYRRIDKTLAVFPLAIPMCAGPGSITSMVMLLDTANGVGVTISVIAALCTVLLIDLVFKMTAPHMLRRVGDAGVKVISALLGCLLAALAMQFVLSGVGQFLVWTSMLPARMRNNMVAKQTSCLELFVTNDCRKCDKIDDIDLETILHSN